VILNSNDPRIWTAFLRGLFEADGTVGSDHGPCLSTASRRLWLEVQQLLLALGVVAKSDMGRSIGHLGNQPIYRLRMANADQARLFARRVGFLSQRKSELLDVLIDREDRMATKNDILPFNVELCEELLRVVTAPKDRRTLRTVCKYGSITRDLFDSLAWRYDLAYTRLAALAAMDVCFDTVRFCEEKEAQPTFDISVPTNNTYIANGFISHNTISFMMDCDTTGVEPDIAIVKYKRLVGGGLLKMVNQTVPRALKRLGYDGKEIQEIVEYIDEHETIEDAPGLKDKHLPVFDCAFKPIKGTRSIHYLGHLKMVAAVQPFLSGAVSKTINVPSEVTVEEIADAYIQAWKLGLKAVAIYRDGCKRVQPLATGEKKKADAQPAVAVEPVPVRRRLPMDRQAICHKFEIAGHEGYIHVGFYEDSTPGEIFIKMAKEGSTISGLMDTIATLTSLALQYGVPLEALVSKFSHVRFEPSGFTKNPDIPYAKSLTDYIFRFLGSRFLSTEQKQEAGLGEEETEKRRNGETETSPLPDSPIPRFSVSFFPWQAQADAPSCADCGAIMIRNGSCYKCLNCGATSGCS
jgi:ribonucleoside-diphosphate reductase alpha chain